MENDDTITALELKRLIVELLDHSPDTRIRFRVIGNMWEKNYLQIVHTTTDNSMVVQDGKSDLWKLISLGKVVEFEIEQRFRQFRPHCHYKVQAR